MLYVPLKGKGEDNNIWSQVIRSIRKNVDKHGFNCVPDPSAYGGYRCEMIKPKQGQKDVGKKNKANIMWTGESHITVAYGEELETVAEERGMDVKQLLQSAVSSEGELFHVTRGLDMPIYRPEPKDVKLLYGVASMFTTPMNTPPIAVILPVVCTNVKFVREALGLDSQTLTTHVTIGYVIPKKGESGALTTMDKDPTTPTAKSIAKLGAVAAGAGEIM